jgi:anti-sigma B factor antagonist
MVGFFVLAGQLMKITTSVTEDGIVLLEVEGVVDAHTAPRLKETLSDWLAQGHSRVILNASQIEHISSAGLQVLLYAQQEARQRGGEVRLFGINAQVHRVIELAGFEKLLYICHTRQEAMEGW